MNTDWKAIVTVALFLLSGTSLLSQGTWTDVSPENVQIHFRDGLFFSPKEGYVVGWAEFEDGSITTTLSRTNDGGKTWMSQDFQEVELNAVSFIDQQNGIVVGRSVDCNCPIIFSTSDGGLFWSEMKVEEVSGSFNMIDFVDQLKGVVGGGDPETGRGFLYRTVDGGKNYTKLMDEEAKHISRLDFVTPNLLFIVAGEIGGGEEMIYRSQNPTADPAQFSMTEMKNFGETAVVTGIDFVDELYGVASLTRLDPETFDLSGDVYRTEDGGNSWSSIYTTTDYTLVDVDFLDAEHGIAVGASSAALITEDGGSSWKDITTFATDLLTWCSYTSPSTIYTAGINGIVLKYSNNLMSVPTDAQGAPQPYVVLRSSAGGREQRLVVGEGVNGLTENKLEIVDERGSVVARYQLSISGEEIELSQFIPGLYLYRLIEQGRVIESGRVLVE